MKLGQLRQALSSLGGSLPLGRILSKWSRQWYGRVICSTCGGSIKWLYSCSPRAVGASGELDLIDRQKLKSELVDAYVQAVASGAAGYS